MKTNAEQLVRQIVRNLNPYMNQNWLSVTDDIWKFWINAMGSERDKKPWNFVQAGVKLLTKNQEMGDVFARAYSQLIGEINKQAWKAWDNNACLHLFHEEPDLYRFLCEYLREQFDQQEAVSEDNEKQYLGKLIVYHLMSPYREQEPIQMAKISRDAYFEEKQKNVYRCCNELGNALLTGFSAFEAEQNPIAEEEIAVQQFVEQIPEMEEDTMNTCMDVVREYLDGKQMNYREFSIQEDIQTFELHLTSEEKGVLVKVFLQSDPAICRIDCIYPFRADKDFIFPLCEKMMAENYPRRFGALQYDASDGELSYRYSFPITHGLHRDDFDMVFMIVVASAFASYEDVRRFAAGRFRRADREEIICKAQKLIIELD